MAQPFHLQSISLPLTGTADAASAIAVAAVGKITCACRHRRCGVGSSRWNINHAAVRPRVISVGTTSNPLILDIPVSFGVLCVAQYNHKLFFMTIKDRIIFLYSQPSIVVFSCSCRAVSVLQGCPARVHTRTALVLRIPASWQLTICIIAGSAVALHHQRRSYRTMAFAVSE